jgi:hypothetical protein
VINGNMKRQVNLMSRKRILIPLIALLVTMLACDLSVTPASQPAVQPPSVNVETSVARTRAFDFAVQTAAAGQPAAPTSQPPKSTDEPTTSPAMISASVDTNCRKGPSTIYEAISYLLVGKTSEVVNKYQNGAWWVIKDPNDPNKRCWVWGQTTMVTGNWQQLAEATMPPTPSLQLIITGSVVFPGSPDPDSYAGPCPVYPQLSWSVESNLPITIGYMFLPGSGWTEHYTFTGPGTKNWSYETTITHSGSFWERLEIVSPLNLSEEVTYTVTCSL